MQASDFIKIIFEVLYNTGRSVLNQEVQHHESFYQAAPLFRLRLNLGDLLPEVLHDGVVALPTVSVFGKYLKLAIGDMPIFVRGGFLKDHHIFRFLKEALIGILTTTSNVSMR